MIFLLTAIAALSLIYGLFGFRIIRPAPLHRKWKAVSWTGLLVCFVSVPVTMALRSHLSGHPSAVALGWFTYLNFGFFTLCFAGTLFRDVLMLAVRLAGILGTRLSQRAHARSENPDSTTAPDHTRRLFLLNATNAALVGGTCALTGYGIIQATRVPEVRHVDIPLKNLPRGFQGFKILQISDLHASMTIRRDYIQKVVERVNAHNPDMIVFTGDLADGSTGFLASETRPLGELNARFGKFFVTGNHEYYSGVRGWLREIQDLGFTPLLNEHRIIERQGDAISLAGITDYSAGTMVPAQTSDPEKALKKAPKDLPRILLAHQPKSIFNAAPEGIDLMISGHTHGGQYIPWNLMVPLDQPYVSGLHRHGRALVYVSRGTGYWGPPMRVGAPSEITALNLVSHPS